MKSLLIHIKGKQCKYMEYAHQSGIKQSFKLRLRKWIAEGWVNVEWNLFWDLTGSSEIVMKVGLLFFISICLKSRCFSSLRHPGFVSVTDIKPQKLLNAGRNCSRLSTAEQAALGAGSFETGTMGNNAVRRLCFLEARKDIAATGKLYIFISGCSVLWYIVKC